MKESVYHPIPTDDLRYAEVSQGQSLPCYYIHPELARVAINTPLPKAFDWKCVPLPHEWMVLIAPRGLQHDRGRGEIQSIWFTPTDKGFQLYTALANKPGWWRFGTDHEIEQCASLRLFFNTVFAMIAEPTVIQVEATQIHYASDAAPDYRPPVIGHRLQSKYGQPKGHHASPREHSRRGHYRHYTNGTKTWIKAAKVNAA